VSELAPADWEITPEVDPVVAELRAEIQKPILRDAYESRIVALEAELDEVKTKLAGLDDEPVAEPVEAPEATPEPDPEPEVVDDPPKEDEPAEAVKEDKPPARARW
jgi:hypothetical protein